MDRATVDIYDAAGHEWTRQRSPYQQELAGWARPEAGLALDAGCGPGWYGEQLGDTVVSLDASATMLDQVVNPLRIRADLAALPFRRGGFAGALGANSYVHLPRSALPMALADLHRCLQVGARVSLSLFRHDSSDDPEFRRSTDGDFAGRGFSAWRSSELAPVLVGAGFAIDSIVDRHDVPGELIEIRATRDRTLPDTVGPDLDVLVCGLNPSLHAADAGVGFVTSNNRFWPAAHAAGLVGEHRDPWQAFRDGVGMTDVVKRATTKASELRAAEYREGMERLRGLIEWLRPGVTCFVGLAGYRAAVDRSASAGRQPDLGGRPVYVMPSTSGLNAGTSLAQLTEHLRAARELGQAG